MIENPAVFVSYASGDRKYFNELNLRLMQLRITHNVTIIDGEINQEYTNISYQTQAMKSDIAIILVSSNYLTGQSNYGMNDLNPLISSFIENNIVVIPFLLRPSNWIQSPLVYRSVIPASGKTLEELNDLEKDVCWKILIDIIETRIHNAVASHNVFDDSIEIDENHPPSFPMFSIGDTSEEKHFFISHAKENGDFAEILRLKLETFGYIGLIDIDVLEAGVDWRNEIDELILQSQALILIISPDAKTSEYVTYEWAFALGSRKRIVPLMLQQTSIHPRLEPFQYLDFTNRHARPWDQLLQLLEKISHSETDFAASGS